MEYSVQEEKANAISHGVGVLLSCAALILLVVQACLHGDAWHIVSFSVFGVALVTLYTCSTLLHSVRHPRLKDIFEVLDHAAIYVLIAGTYTPFLLVTLRGPMGWTFFGVIWGLALAGIVLKIFYVKRFILISTLCYILMGWLIVIAFKPLYLNLPFGGIVWLVVGGLLYTFGSIFYVWRRIPYHHAIWHIFVLAGSACHFVSIFGYVIMS
ncbi:hemolysin III family protein [Paenibacillus chondroitinus]|uniref:Hemolysin III family protein n=1 Tax=Paenibacillus chondroitinus TaxID=59842 RepID=A0ABU6DKF6_9BACL|nr:MULTISPECIES: hemolysin III family protein [Paenibacillus]MCY9662035.1 hemolysin III family protein [Paenibacillus anseongense]MEB4798251.1 hemolysin III family protein [Paenibacillus chondroitinus]